MKLTQEQRYQLLDIFTAEGGDSISAQMMAKSYGLSDEQFSEFQYRCTRKLIKDFLYAGKSKSYRPKNATDEEIKKGISVEFEHTTNPKIAKKIAFDHISEIPDYYERLERMEQEAKKEMKEKNNA